MMKFFQLLFIACLALTFTSEVIAQASTAPSEQALPQDGPAMSFDNLIVDYGEIVQHSDPLRVAKFTNTGTEPLIIKNARGSCGCTVPTYPKEPIMPGETAEMEIRYDTKRLGRINKTVTITTNQLGDPIVLKVKGNISKAAKEENIPKPKSGLFKSGN